MMENWKKIFATKMAHQAEIVKAVLEEQAILAVVLNKTDTAYPGIFEGSFEVYVLPESEAEALKIVAHDITF
ncbi:MAG: DUF2007 domain-containing protein [Microscillaceae bacterium]|nr:DUF2007 domain-containing protein [Microscillaceae bacterium]